MTQSIPILYEDAEALVIDKPAGLPLDPPRAGGDSLANYLDRLKLGFARAPMPAHRLDRDTSGCLLLARNPRSLRRFGMNFAEHRVEKRYLGIVAGQLPDGAGTITLALAKISSKANGWRIIPAKKSGKAATTHWRRLAEVNGLTLVEFQPETGRTHQIRVHAASGLGVALLGDPIYGHTPNTPDTTPGAGRMMLHAASLAMPRDHKPPILAHAPLPADFAALGFGEWGAGHGGT